VEFIQKFAGAEIALSNIYEKLAKPLRARPGLRTTNEEHGRKIASAGGRGGREAETAGLSGLLERHQRQLRRQEHYPHLRGPMPAPGVFCAPELARP
jgi:hypothetical protein